jgi:hypothetical protein
MYLARVGLRVAFDEFFNRKNASIKTEAENA